MERVEKTLKPVPLFGSLAGKAANLRPLRRLSNLNKDLNLNLKKKINSISGIIDFVDDNAVDALASLQLYIKVIVP